MRGVATPLEGMLYQLISANPPAANFIAYLQRSAGGEWSQQVFTQFSILSSTALAMTESSAGDIITCHSAPGVYEWPIGGHLKVALEAMGRAVAAGDVVIHEGEQLRLPTTEAVETPSELDSDHRQLFSEIGTLEWPALITEMDSKVRFSWTLLGRSP